MQLQHRSLPFDSIVAFHLKTMKIKIVMSGLELTTLIRNSFKFTPYRTQAVTSALLLLFKRKIEVEINVALNCFGHENIL